MKTTQVSTVDESIKQMWYMDTYIHTYIHTYITLLHGDAERLGEGYKLSALNL